MIKNLLVCAAVSLLLASCNFNKASIDDNLKKYYDAYGVEGCFTFLNNNGGKITVYNMSLDTQRFLPASSFKIISSLIGLETGRITDENMIINWDGVRRKKEWDRTMTMKDAFRVSNVPFFQEVVRRTGKETMQKWIDSLSYGNRDLSGPVDSFWLNNTLKISPDEQLGLMKKLYFDQLPFRKGVMETVRNLMVQEDKTAYKLSYKTGHALDGQNNQVAWVCGWIEENKHVYFFVNLVKTPKTEIDAGAVSVKVTRDILKEYGFFEGKM